MAGLWQDLKRGLERRHEWGQWSRGSPENQATMLMTLDKTPRHKGMVAVSEASLKTSGASEMKDQATNIHQKHDVNL